MINYRDVSDGCLFPVWVQPRSSKNQIVGEHEGALKIKLTSPPVEGEANQELCQYLARRLKIAKTRIKIEQGQANRHKLLHISSMSGQEVLEILGYQG